jgi:hypothetical protein
MLCAMRLSGQDWLPRKDDPLKTLHTKLVADERAALKSGHRADPRAIYSYTVSAIRAELAGRGLSTMQGTDIDWGEEGDRIREGTGDLEGRRSEAGKRAWEEGRQVRDPSRAAPLLAHRERLLAEKAQAEAAAAPAKAAPSVRR